jgi:small-conductance mechanosensitive channel
MPAFVDVLIEWGVPTLACIAITLAALWSVRRAFPNHHDTRLSRQLGHLLVFLFANILLVLALPLENATQGQLLSLFGIVLTAIIALSSTTFVANAMAGLMLRAVAGFREGDFIRVGEHFGRVAEKGLLHTRVQTEDRDLVTLPNLLVMNNPVQVVQANGTLISATVSLGYESHHSRIAEHLKAAAEATGLDDAFVQITELGDSTVTYRVVGLLTDVSSLVSKRSELRGRTLDHLHEAGIEVVSPSFMNQRQLAAERKVIPERFSADPQASDTIPEDLMFDKAAIAGRLAELRDQRARLSDEIKVLEEDHDSDDVEIKWRQRQLESLDVILNATGEDSS